MKSVLLIVNNNLKFLFLSFFNLLIIQSISAQTAIPTIDLTNFKWGLKDSATNKVILVPTYDYITKFKNGVAFVQKEELYGFIDKTGKEITPPIYDNYSWANDSLIKLKKDNLYALFTPKMEEVMPFVFEKLTLHHKYLVVNNGESSGVIDLAGNIIIPFVYDDIYFEYSSRPEELESIKIRVTKDLKMGTIDIENRVIIPIEYDGLEFQSNGMVFAKKDNRFGLLSNSGSVIIPLKDYDFLETSSEYVIAAGIDGKYGYIEYTGKIFIYFHYQDARAFHYELGAVKKDGLWGAINYDNEVVIPFEYESPVLFKNGISRLEKQENEISKFAYINAKGEVITDFVYDEAEDFSRNHALVRIGKKWGLLNRSGKPLIPIDYDKIYLKREYVIVTKNHLQGLYKLTGQLILPTEYSFIYPPSDHELIMVRNGSRYGYVNHSGELIIPIIYENARSFAYGRATVLLEGESFEIDEKGERLSKNNF